MDPAPTTPTTPTKPGQVFPGLVKPEVPGGLGSPGNQLNITPPPPQQQQAPSPDVKPKRQPLPLPKSEVPQLPLEKPVPEAEGSPAPGQSQKPDALGHLRGPSATLQGEKLFNDAVKVTGTLVVGAVLIAASPLILLGLTIHQLGVFTYEKGQAAGKAIGEASKDIDDKLLKKGFGGDSPKLDYCKHAACRAAGEFKNFFTQRIPEALRASSSRHAQNMADLEELNYPKLIEKNLGSLELQRGSLISKQDDEFLKNIQKNIKENSVKLSQLDPADLERLAEINHKVKDRLEILEFVSELGLDRNVKNENRLIDLLGKTQTSHPRPLSESERKEALELIVQIKEKRKIDGMVNEIILLLEDSNVNDTNNYREMLKVDKYTSGQVGEIKDALGYLCVVRKDAHQVKDKEVLENINKYSKILNYLNENRKNSEIDLRDVEGKMLDGDYLNKDQRERLSKEYSL